MRDFPVMHKSACTVTLNPSSWQQTISCILCGYMHGGCCGVIRFPQCAPLPNKPMLKASTSKHTGAWSFMVAAATPEASGITWQAQHGFANTHCSLMAMDVPYVPPSVMEPARILDYTCEGDHATCHADVLSYLVQMVDGSMRLVGKHFVQSEWPYMVSEYWGYYRDESDFFVQPESEPDPEATSMPMATSMWEEAPDMSAATPMPTATSMLAATSGHAATPPSADNKETNLHNMELNSSGNPSAQQEQSGAGMGDRAQVHAVSNNKLPATFDIVRKGGSDTDSDDKSWTDVAGEAASWSSWGSKGDLVTSWELLSIDEELPPQEGVMMETNPTPTATAQK